MVINVPDFADILVWICKLDFHVVYNSENTLMGGFSMLDIKLPWHNEGQITRRLQPTPAGKREFTDPSDTLPSFEAYSNARDCYLYQGGKWVREDDTEYGE